MSAAWSVRSSSQSIRRSPKGASSPFVAVGSGYYIGLGKIGGTPASPLAGGLPPLVDSGRRLAVRHGLPLMGGWAVQESHLRVSHMHDPSQMVARVSRGRQ